MAENRGSSHAVWFKHDANARGDRKLIALLMKYGLAGLGAYWCVCEFSAEAVDHRFQRTDIDLLAFDVHAPTEEFIAMVEYMIHLELLTEDSSGIYSPSLLRRMTAFDEYQRRRSEAGRKAGLASGRARAQQSSNDRSTNARRKGTEQKGKEKKTPLEQEDSSSSSGNSPSDLFIEFWTQYPLKKGKRYAQKAWEKILPDADTYSHIVTGLKAQIEERHHRESLGLWVPAWKHCATWLNGRCWEDVIQSEEEIQAEHGLSGQRNGSRPAPSSPPASRYYPSQSRALP